MNRKVAVPELYLPSTSKNYTYYPIQQKKMKNASTDVNPPTIRIERQPREMDCLRRANEELKEREEIYIDKLMKLEEGLENQHREFVKLQELYTQLFQSYKQKELEIAQLEFKYRQSSRRHYQQKICEARPAQEMMTVARRDPDEGLRELEMVKRQKDWIMRETELMELNQILTQKLQAMNQNYEKMMQELSSLKNKQRGQSKTPGNDKIMEEIQELQKKIDAEMQTRLKYQYENEFLKNRMKDLQSQREELQKLLSYKQKEIGKLREEKIHIHRQTSEKIMNRSLSSSSRVLKTNQTATNKDFNQTSKESKVNLTDQSQGSSQYSKIQQYFSFSREKKELELEEGLPSFPPGLEIDSLINQHKQ